MQINQVAVVDSRLVPNECLWLSTLLSPVSRRCFYKLHEKLLHVKKETIGSILSLIQVPRLLRAMTRLEILDFGATKSSVLSLFLLRFNFYHVYVHGWVDRDADLPHTQMCTSG